MSLLDSVLRGATRSTSLSGTANPKQWLLDVLGTEPVYSGKTVTPESAMRLLPVYTAVSTIAGDIGSMPLVVYQRQEPRGRSRARQHRTWAMLHDQPNPYMAADEYWENVLAHLLLWGEHYSVKERDPATDLVTKLWPLYPDRVAPGWENGVPYYLIDGKRYGPADIFHVRGLTLDGLYGVSPVAIARQAVGNGLALEEFQGRFWNNGAFPSGVLKTDQELSDKAAKRLERRWNAENAGLVNAARTAILEEGMTWERIGLTLADAQFLEQSKAGRTDIALMYRLPPYKLAADSGASMRYENTETQSIDYVKFSLRYWMRRCESALLRDPDIFVQGSRFYAEFLADALLRGDSAQRAAYYTAALDPVKGWMRREEVRDLENLNPEDNPPEPPPAPKEDRPTP